MLRFLLNTERLPSTRKENSNSSPGGAGAVEEEEILRSAPSAKSLDTALRIVNFEQTDPSGTKVKFVRKQFGRLSRYCKFMEGYYYMKDFLITITISNTIVFSSTILIYVTIFSVVRCLIVSLRIYNCCMRNIFSRKQQVYRDCYDLFEHHRDGYYRFRLNCLDGDDRLLQNLLHPRQPPHPGVPRLRKRLDQV